MARRTLLEKLDRREIHLPSPIVHVLVRTGCFFYNLKYKPKYIYHFDRDEMKGKQVILLSDHASNHSSFYAVAGYPFVKLNAVLGYQHFFTRFLYTLFTQYGAIPKRNFETDLRAVRQMVKVINMGGSLLLFPEGTFSFAGSNQPINPSTVNFIKQLGVTVVLCKSRGLFCSLPVYRKKEIKGHKEIHYEILFTPEELKEKSNKQLYRKFLDRFRYNDLDWNLQERHKYLNPDGNAEGIDKMLFVCPKCGKEYTMHVEGEEFVCNDCGNRVKIDEYYATIPVGKDSVCKYRHINEWFIDQRKIVRKQIRKRKFEISYECELKDLHTDKARFKNFFVCGEGRVTINHDGIRYVGTKNGKQVDLQFKLELIPCFKCTLKGENILYYHNETFVFKPKTNTNRIMKYMIAVEELHNSIDPVWKKVYADAYGR